MNGSTGSQTAHSPTKLAQELLIACKRTESTEPHRQRLADLTDEQLHRVRTDHRTGLAFWLNCYNAGTQLLLREHPERYESPLRFVRFFLTGALTVGGTRLSLDRIENGILRARSKYGVGYVPKLLVTSFEHRYRLSKLDYRIHFALNCGAKSCPAIRAYDPAEIDEQLSRASRSYLESTVEYDPDAGIVRVPRVFLWFRGDFGGRSGVLEILRTYGSIPDDSAPAIRHQSWDWAKAAGQFIG
jgi:hypothetical protein